MNIFDDAKSFYRACISQDFIFYMVAAYIIFSYMRPQVIYSWLDLLPWTQLTIVFGLFAIIKNKHFTFNTAQLLVLLFALVTVASSFSSYYPDNSFSKIDIGFIWWLEVLFFTNAVRTLQQLRLILILLFIVLFKMSLFGAKTWMLRGFAFTKWGLAGPSGFFANSGEFSLLMAMFAAMSLAFLIGLKIKNKWYYLAPITAIMTVLGASSRGGQLALIVGLFFVGVVVMKVSFRNIIVAILVCFLAYSFLPEEQKQRFESMGDDGTSSSRLFYWEKGFEMLKEHPVLGIGYYSFPQYFADYYSHERRESGITIRRQEVSHNSFVEVSSTMGYLGLGVYLSLILYCFQQNKKTRRFSKLNNNPSGYWTTALSYGFDASLLTYIVGSFFMSVAFYPYIYLSIMLSYSLANCVGKDSRKA